MVYNKTKRGLELAAGIVGIVGSAISIVCFIYYFGWCVYVMTTTAILLMILLFAVEVCSLIFSSLIIKSPFKNGIVKKTTGIRVCAMVFAGLTGNLITLGLMIAVVCLKDLVDEPAKVTTATVNNSTTIDSKIAELKRFKELGIIDDAQYEKAITKIIEEIK